MERTEFPRSTLDRIIQAFESAVTAAFCEIQRDLIYFKRAVRDGITERYKFFDAKCHDENESKRKNDTKRERI